MATEGTSKKTLQLPLLLKLDTARKLAEKWVTEMGWPPEGDSKPTGAILEPRPPGLGIGATIPRESSTSARSNMFSRSNDPLERRLRAKFNAKERKEAERKADECAERVDDDSDGEESESRTKAFTKKKRPAGLSSLLNPKKKCK